MDELGTFTLTLREPTGEAPPSMLRIQTADQATEQEEAGGEDDTTLRDAADAAQAEREAWLGGWCACHHPTTPPRSTRAAGPAVTDSSASAEPGLAGTSGRAARSSPACSALARPTTGRTSASWNWVRVAAWSG